MSNEVMSELALLARERLRGSLVPGPVTYVDFPDHGNIGDSVIFLGCVQALRQSVSPVRWASDFHAGSRIDWRSRGETLILAGGGFTGGHYARHDNLRIRLAAEVPAPRVVQAPQSVSWKDPEWRNRYAKLAESRPEFPFMVRDEYSVDALTDIGFRRVSLVPDLAHALWPISCGDAELPTVAIGRTDAEVGNASWGAMSSVRDWPVESRLASRRVRQLAGMGAALLNRPLPVQRSALIAERRLELGVEMASEGSVLVTDRLHAMILGLLCDRRVIAVDNSLFKLSRYAATWLRPLIGDRLHVTQSGDRVLELLEGWA